MPNFDLLIVDDDPSFLFLHEVLAKKSGFHEQPRKFEDGEEVIQFLEENEGKNYLLFLDIYMKKLDGWGVLEILDRKNCPSKIKVILITSSINSEDKNRAIDYANVIEYIEKPLLLEYLQHLKDQVIF
ncbi:response regulator [Algoriphagus vanfongensis]|uniref:response regulator n=1 Tax=Algoriphagus vanfongensis TaxID=426371 RepID=UPI0003FD7287|nr:response regulator [Algoriphagus vanfongensis]